MTGRMAMSKTAAGFLSATAPALVVGLALASGVAFAQSPKQATPGPKTLTLEPQVEVAPIRCWWRSTTGAVTIGEPFDVRLTCAVLDTESVQVVPDETHLTVSGIQLKPFEVVGGSHPADTHAGDRRFFQYLYTLRLIDPDVIGNDVTLPKLGIAYKVQSRIGADATLAGRDFLYVMPDISVRVLSQVPVDAEDIRDGADIGLERVDTLQFRARLFELAAIALFAGAALVGVFAIVSLVAGARPSRSRERARVPDRRVLGAVNGELARLSQETAGGWSPDLIRAAHAAARIVAAIAIGRGVSEQPLAADAEPADGRLAVRARIPRRSGVAVMSAATPADVGKGALHDALATFTAAQFASGTAVPDSTTLSSALETVRAEADRLASERRWPWSSRSAKRDASSAEPDGSMAAV